MHRIPEKIRQEFLRQPDTPKDPSSVDQWLGWLELAYEDDQQRWRHVRGAHQKARVLSKHAIQLPNGLTPHTLELACALHDVGRVFDPNDSYPHAPIGAEFIKNLGLDPVPALVAFHSGAEHECRLRGHPEALNGWSRSTPEAHALVDYIDMTTGPDGRSISLDERYTDIIRRYGETSFQARAFKLGEAEFRRGEALYAEIVS